MGIEHAELIRRILDAALTRLGMHDRHMRGPRDDDPREARVAVLYNAPVLEPDHPDAASEADVVAVARVVTEALARQGSRPGRRRPGRRRCDS